jgi:hypothetical protein
MTARRRVGAGVNEHVPGEPLPGDPPRKHPSPLRVLLKRHGIDAGPFVLWLGPKLGDYRFEKYVREQMPARAEVRDALRKLRKSIHDLHRGLIELSPHARAALQGRAGTDVDIRRMTRELPLLGACVAATEAAVAATRKRTGPKRATPRDDLLAAVVEQLLRAAKMPVSKARDLAGQILALCGIDAPAHERSLRRRVVRSRGA